MTSLMTASRFSAELRAISWPCGVVAHPIVDAYAAVSVGNKSFSGARLEALLLWIERHVVRCRLVVGGELSRWTVMMERGITEDDAKAVAARHENRKLAELRRAVLHVERPEVFSLTTCAELRSHPRFRTAAAEISAIRSNDSRFAELIRLSARRYCEARVQKGRPMAVSFATAEEFSTAFIAEELALFCVLVSTGSPVEIYPGPELPVLAEIAAGRFPEVPLELRERVNVEVEINPSPPGPNP